jgi:hypothetical protein
MKRKASLMTAVEAQKNQAGSLDGALGCIAVDQETALLRTSINLVNFGFTTGLGFDARVRKSDTPCS